MTRLEDFDVLLMLDPRSGDLFPFSSHGFKVGTGRLSRISSRSRGLLFLDQNGRLLELTSVNDIRPDLWGRLHRFFGGAYSISVSLIEKPTDLDQLKEMILTGIIRYKEYLDGDDSWSFVLLPIDHIKKAIRDAKDTKSLFERLDLPDAVDCLDLL
ncbi:hypothetical protein [Yoonia sp. 2307UL14-13]|uniref:hypothetical protein n=1 Tax=Yoonia sp. 2307UL14-13 TaxID=3126506 RepID=UPI00309ACA62